MAGRGLDFGCDRGDAGRIGATATRTERDPRLCGHSFDCVRIDHPRRKNRNSLRPFHLSKKHGLAAVRPPAGGRAVDLDRGNNQCSGSGSTGVASRAHDPQLWLLAAWDYHSSDCSVRCQPRAFRNPGKKLLDLVPDQNAVELVFNTMVEFHGLDRDVSAHPGVCNPYLDLEKTRQTIAGLPSAGSLVPPEPLLRPWSLSAPSLVRASSGHNHSGRQRFLRASRRELVIRLYVGRLHT